jgi:hypothetical protein
MPDRRRGIHSPNHPPGMGGSKEHLERMERRERFSSRSLHMHIDNLALTEPHLPQAHTFDFRPNWHALSRQAPNDVFEEVLYYDS